MEELKSTLNTYKLQLVQIESAIAAGQVDSDLLLLQDEMKELIKLTEESLLSYEKSNLLSILDGPANGNDTKVFESKTPGKKSFTKSEHSPPSEVPGRIDDELALFYAGMQSTSDEVIQQDSTSPAVLIESTSSSDGGDDTIKKTPAKFQTETDVTNGFECYVDLGEANFDQNEKFLETIENCDDITGVRCRAPFKTEWSGVQYHNAMIMSVADSKDARSCRKDCDPDVSVQVLFLNPTLEQMRPCPYMLNDTCKFSDSDCKFSHGHAVSLYVLRKFIEPDFSSFTVGSKCLAKHTGGVWQVATVVTIHDDHRYSIKFLHQNSSDTLNIDEIFPIPDVEDDEDSSSSDEEDDVIVLLDDTVKPVAGQSSVTSSKLGAWEEHTNGFGSRILMKFGYKLGEGLGKNGEGRVEPVPVVVLPPGKSLDHCMMIKQRKKGIVDKTTSDGHARKRHRHTVFHFLNRTIGDKGTTSDRLRNIIPKDSFGINKPKVKSGVQCKINAELLKNDNKIKQLKAKISKLKMSVSRNRERNPSVAKTLQAKLNEVQAELLSLQSENSAMELHQKRADTHRKMTRF